MLKRYGSLIESLEGFIIGTVCEHNLYLHQKEVEEELVKESFSMCEVLLLHVDDYAVFINISCIFALPETEYKNICYGN